MLKQNLMIYFTKVPRVGNRESKILVTGGGISEGFAGLSFVSIGGCQGEILLLRNLSRNETL